MMKSVGKLFGLRRKCPPPKTLIDKKKTRVNPIDRMLDDSDEGSYASTTSVSSESEYQNSEDESGTSDSSYRARESEGDDSSETDEKCAVPRRQRKRSASAPQLDDSDSSDSSSDVGGEPLRRVLQRKRLRLPEDSEDEALREKKREAELKEAAAKRRERKNKLMELSKRRKSGTTRRRRRTLERVECYPKLRVMMTRVQTKGCEACELHRTGRFTVRLSGQLYHNNTLQEDQFMPDDSQSFFVGSVCASRTEVYHALKHFKYHLFERCRTALEAQKEIQEDDTGEDDEPIKDTVNKVFTKLQDGGWISEQYEKFQEHLNSADFFQEEKLD
ncbi:coiled-coil domain-containing 82-like protein [Labeo rohita]|uniref:Coiled-coil domain-containing 82-like protein n=1 Tax=Labeo rohita TaxID=84645 RepID=A0A498LH64_LABRO|nr:coiled-coil domain-containing 82-like protein [Labeo rohita]